MACRECGATLERPGDFCLRCRTRNTDSVVVDADRSRATVTMLAESDRVGETTVTTTPETGEEHRRERRNFVGRIADNIRRKRPDIVFVAGDRDVIQGLRETLHYDVRRVTGSDPVAAAIDRRGTRSLDVVEKPPREKIGGSHSTVVGGRDGQTAVTTVAGHPNVKKVVPGPIESGGSRSGGGVRAKATRADTNGNIRLLIRDGTTVQENRVVTTAMDRETGEVVRTDLNAALRDTGLQSDSG